MNNREIQKEQRKQTILSKGLELFITKGYGSTKITDIAKSVNMSNGLFFHYYPNTESLYLELAQIGLKATKDITKKQDMPALLFFEGMCEFLLKEINKNSFTAQMFVLMNSAIRSFDTPSSVKEVVSQVNTTKELALIIKRGQAEGTIKEGNELALANTFISCITGVAINKAVNNNMIIPKANWIVDIIRK